MRQSGVLVPVFSLPSPYGIGSFSREAYEFVDFLAGSGQSIWQVLPMGPTGFGDSPYQPYSTFAGNPNFIDLDALADAGLLSQEEYTGLDYGSDPENVDYSKVSARHEEVLRLAYGRFRERGGLTCSAYLDFMKENKAWIDGYALYRSLRRAQGDREWFNWDEELRDSRSGAVRQAAAGLTDEIGYYGFQQFLFDRQWSRLRAYANARGVKIMGDIPFYVSGDSSDVWSNPDAFLLDENYQPVMVAGCPPDAFSEDGQLWGNPLYNWDTLKKRGYDWWVARLMHCFRTYDLVRVDHFRGFAAYFAIPADAKTAREGHWVEGPGKAVFEAVNRAFGGPCPIVAEDLGIITDDVRALLDDCGFPGMKVLQFAFSGEPENTYLPYNVERRAVIYTGTHDNETTCGWIAGLDDWHRDFVRRYANSLYTSYEAFTWDFIRMAMGSVCEWCIVPLQDYLVMDNRARVNTPGTVDINWKWRLRPHTLSEDLRRSMYALTQLYGRLVPAPKDGEAAIDIM